MKVREIMSKDVACLRSDDSIEKAAQMMKDHSCGSIPVCSQDKVIGIVTDRDIAVRSVADGQDTCRQSVRDVMTGDVVCGNPDMEVSDAAKLMSDRQIRRLPIIENNNLIGMVALGDISQEPKYQDNAGHALKGISEPGTRMW